MFFEKMENIKEELSSFSNNSKIWVYYSQKEFSKHTIEIQSRIDDFVSNWTSHGDKVFAKGYCIENQIIILVADSEKADVSGCSTDSSIHFIQDIGNLFNLDFFDRSLVYYLKGEKISSIALNEIKSLSNDTLVFNPYFNNLDDWEQNFISPIAKSMFKNLA